MNIRRVNVMEWIISVAVMSVASFVFLIQSPLHPWVNGISSTDSSVFKTVAIMMQNGYMPYKDSFDHKGPLTYVINYVGNQISYYRGVWVIELISLTITMLLLYRIARMLSGIIVSYVVVFVALIPLFEYFKEGNFVEEYAMPFIAASLFIFLDYLMNHRITNFRLILCGFCLGSVLMLRPNMISAWMVFALMIAIVEIREGRWQELMRYIGLFIVGMTMIIIPLMIWLACGDALKDFWEAYVVFNFRYVNAGMQTNGLIGGVKKFGNTFCYLASIIALLYTAYTDKKGRGLNITYIIYMLVTLYMVAMSGRDFEHYGMIMVPMFVYPLSLLASGLRLQPSIEKDRAEPLVLLACICAFYYLILPDWSTAVNNVAASYATRNEDIYYDDDINALVKCVEKYTDDEDKISVYGNWDYVYVICHRLHATRFSYQPRIGQGILVYKDEYFNELLEELPRIIVVQKGRMDDSMETFLDENHYDGVIVGNVDEYSVYALEE